MHAEKCLFSFNGLTVLMAACLCACCDPWQESPRGITAAFAVFDVGQGLAQALIAGGDALLFDMGPAESFPDWQEQYRALGNPVITAVVLSHTHADHFGGLTLLDSGFAWSGLLIVNPYEDTVYIRNIVPRWRDRIRFRTVAAGDTMALIGGAEIRCLWPPAALPGSIPCEDSLENRLSSVFRITLGLTGALITSDIDTLAERALCLHEADGLAADMMVVPHHGSAGSLDAVFYGHVRQRIAVISYGAGNTFGHPSRDVLLLLSQMGALVRTTALNGCIIAESNGYSWALTDSLN